MTTLKTGNTRCAIYTRKSSEEGLDQAFNSLHAQREACESYVASQRHEGWHTLSARYDDGGFSGGNMERPGLKRLMEDVAARKVDTVVVYKVDRLTRSLADFAKIVESFDKQGISFVSVTQQFNTTTSMGRLTLNVLLSFAQFEREVTGERIRDKIAASKKKGMWMGGNTPLGYEVRDRQLLVVPEEAEVVREIFTQYVRLGSVYDLREYLEVEQIRSKVRLSHNGNTSGGVRFSRGALYHLLSNTIYVGQIAHKNEIYPGQHQAIVDRGVWDRAVALLKANQQNPHRRRKRKDLSEGSSHLLMGLLFDVRGVRYTPQHAVKQGRRYRYYTSQAVIQKSKIRPPIPRIAAIQIEQLVVQRLMTFLSSAQEISQIVDVDADGIQDLRELIEAGTMTAEKLRCSNIDAMEDFVKSILRRVVVGEARLQIELDRAALYQQLLDIQKAILGTDDDKPKPARITLDCEIQAKRRGNELRLVIPSSPPVQVVATSSLVNALARANGWLDSILDGEFASLAEIAEKEGLGTSYVSRIFRTALLPPHVTEAIVEGRHAADMTLKQLVEDLRQGRPVA